MLKIENVIQIDYKNEHDKNKGSFDIYTKKIYFL
jgi:hypothetical protein